MNHFTKTIATVLAVLRLLKLVLKIENYEKQSRKM